MNQPQVHFTSLLDQASLNYLKNKKLVQGFSHYDVWLTEHQTAFTVAKMMDDDLLAEIKSALQSAIENGTDFHTFKKQLVPYLMSKGWWGEQVMTDPKDGVQKTVQLGSFRRLKTIFDTNLSTAYAAGQWARISASVADFPYLKYISSVSDKQRDSHKKYYNQIWRVDDPIWQSIFPPNGYGCQCTVRQLTEKQALRERGEDIKKQPAQFTDEQKANHAAGKIDDKNIVKWVDFTNPRTGKVVRVPDNVTPTFAHNHGDRLAQLQQLYEEKHGKTKAQKLTAERNRYTLDKVQRPLFDDLGLKPDLTVLNDDIKNAQQLVHKLAGTGEQLGEMSVGKVGSVEMVQNGRQYFLFNYDTNGVRVEKIASKKYLQIKQAEMDKLITELVISGREQQKYQEFVESGIFADADYGKADIADKKAAFLYSTNGGYYDMNKALIKNKGDLKKVGEENAKLAQIVRSIDVFLAKAPKYIGMTTRKLDTSKMVNLDTFLNSHEEGNLVRYSNFSSSTPKGEYGGDGQILLTIHGKSGVDISGLSAYAHEAEVLMPRQAVYRILNKRKKNNVIYIELEEVLAKHYNQEAIIQLSLFH